VVKFFVSGAAQKPDKQKSTQYSFKEILQYCKNMLADWPFIKEHIHSDRDESERNSAWGDFRGPFGYGLCFFVPDVDVHQYIQHSEIHFKDEIETGYDSLPAYRGTHEYIAPKFAGIGYGQYNISEAKFTNAFMAHENFARSDIVASNFSGAVLDSSSFRHAVMFKNDFSQASLKSANMDYINRLNLRGFDHMYGRIYILQTNHYFAEDYNFTSFKTVNMGRELYVSPDLNFNNANLTAASFVSSWIPGSNFQGADLTKTDFAGASLVGSNFSNTTLTDTIFYAADLNFSNFSNTSLGGQSFRNSDYGSCDFGMNNAGLRGVCFDNSTLTGFSFSDADLSQTSFKEAHIRGADFSEAISLQDANFSGAFLDHVTFHWETLKTATWFGENSMKKRGDIQILVDRDVEEVLEEAAQLGVRNLEGLRSLLIFKPPRKLDDWY